MIYSPNHQRLSYRFQPTYHSNWHTNTSNRSATTAHYPQGPPRCYQQPQENPKIRYSYNMAQMTPAEMEEFQNLSDRYQADLPGSLIGEKLPMDILVTEYAQADPTYVVKTAGLAATHSAYRAVKGDGQCGWRATVFSYFELLLHSGDLSLVQLEKIRFESFADTMRQIGLDYDLLADMFDSTWQLFDSIAQAVQNNITDDNVILNVLNDENPSNSVVYHFKMITSAYMELHADDYEPFLEIPVSEYRVTRIDPANQEIDQIGLQALTHAVISTAGFSLEVLYLDRSIGEEVTPHQFSHATGEVPTIRLLYRPGHYDIIYKETQPMQVYLQPQHSVPTQIEPSQDFSHLYLQPVHSTLTHDAENTPEAQEFLFSSPNQRASSYGTQLQPSEQYMQFGSYDSYYQEPAQTYTDMSWYAPAAHQSVPPPVSTPTEPLPQHHTWSSVPNSSRSCSLTISPSPPAAATVTTEPMIRFSSTMWQPHVRHHQTAPMGPCTGR